MKKLFTARAVSRIVRLAILLGITQSAFHAYGHGGVAFEDDLCVINVNFMQAHFTVFQPETRQNTEYCEDIPDDAIRIRDGISARSAHGNGN